MSTPQHDFFEDEGGSKHRLTPISHFYREGSLGAAGQDVACELGKRQGGLGLYRLQIRKLQPYVILDERLIVSGIEEVERHPS